MKAHALAAVAILAGSAGPALAEVTAYEGARLIIGDGRVVETEHWSWTEAGSRRPRARRPARSASISKARP